MARPKPTREGKRVNVWVPGGQLKDHAQIENFSAFVQICIEQAPDIMAFALLRKIDPKKYHARAKMEEVIDDFNKAYPLDELTQKRQGKWQTPSEKIPDVLL